MWTFGDGKTSVLETPETNHIYTVDGDTSKIFKPVLKVMDEDENFDTFTLPISVSPVE